MFYIFIFILHICPCHSKMKNAETRRYYTLFLSPVVQDPPHQLTPSPPIFTCRADSGFRILVREQRFLETTHYSGISLN